MPKAKAEKPAADRTASACPMCGAYPGKPCRDYRGRDKGPCQERGRPKVTAAKLARKAADLNRRKEAEYGPLFKDLMPAAELVTPADVAAKRLRDVRMSAGNDWSLVFAANQGIERIHLWALFRGAAALLGAETEAKVREYALRVFGWGKESYVRGVYETALCTADRIALRMEFREDPATSRVVEWPNSTYPDRMIRINVRGGGLHCTEALEPAGRPLLTRDEFKARFPVPDHRNGSPDTWEPDDGGLFARVLALLPHREAA